jgi:hypothetical protein
MHNKAPISHATTGPAIAGNAGPQSTGQRKGRANPSIVYAGRSTLGTTVIALGICRVDAPLCQGDANTAGW